MTSPAAADDRYAAFRHSSYLRFWSARFLVTFATQIVSVAVGWQIYDLTRDREESTDVAAGNPEVVARIDTYLESARTPSERWPAP